MTTYEANLIRLAITAGMGMVATALLFWAALNTAEHGSPVRSGILSALAGATFVPTLLITGWVLFWGVASF